MSPGEAALTTAAALFALWGLPGAVRAARRRWHDRQPPNYVDGLVLPAPDDPRWQVYTNMTSTALIDREFYIEISPTETLWVCDREAQTWIDKNRRPIHITQRDGKNSRFIGSQQDGPRLYAAIKKAQAEKLLESHLLSET